MVSKLEPVQVEINVETPSLERGAFYNMCFITENDEAPRTVEVNTLSDLLENGYTRLDLAYNFCVGVLSQEGISSVFIRAKRSGESYIDAYDSDDNSDYYFLCAQSKSAEDIKSLNEHVNQKGDMKLQFYSGDFVVSDSESLVVYYQQYTPSITPVEPDNENYYLDKAYKEAEDVEVFPLNFLKMLGEVITIDENTSAGIIYKFNDEPIKASVMKLDEGIITHTTVTGTAVLNYSEMAFSFLNYDPDLLGLGTAPIPQGLEQDFTYIFGFDNAIVAEYLASLGQELPEGFLFPPFDTTLTLYPASKLPDVNLDYDLFSLIIDPDRYSQEELSYFSERGVSPAIKNSDGSYTLKSQVTLSMAT